jgi:hypothetical protein
MRYRALSLASAVTIDAASAEVTASIIVVVFAAATATTALTAAYTTAIALASAVVTAIALSAIITNADGTSKLFRNEFKYTTETKKIKYFIEKKLFQILIWWSILLDCIKYCNCETIKNALTNHKKRPPQHSTKTFENSQQQC